MDTRWHVSPWLPEIGAIEPPAPALTGARDVDVAVIGAGFTGLSAALALADEGLQVAVVEARIAGFGASGRNAGHLTPTIGKDLPTLALMFGDRRTRALVQVAETAVQHTEQQIARLDIACDYEPVGNIFASVHPKQRSMVESAARAAARYGAPGELLDASAMRRRGVPDAFQLGFLEPTGGLLNPAKYVRGLRTAALAAGVTLYEQTPVTRIEPGRRVVIHAAGGQLRADRVVLATNTLADALGVRGPRVARVWVQMFVTEPLSDAQLARISWRERQGIYTAHQILESYRLTADHRIAGGSRYIRYAYGARDLPDVAPGIAKKLDALFRRRFAQLDDVQIARHWGGPIAVSLDFLPQFGRIGPHRNIAYAAGYCGHGVAMASYAGTIVAELLMDRPARGAALWSRTSLGIPPEPLGWAVAQALIGVFSSMDRRLD